MAATTFATWYAAFRDLSLTGVTNLNEPPLDLTGVKLPAKWIQTAGMDGAPFKTGVLNGWPAFRCQVVIVIKPLGQDRHPTRWSDAAAMVVSSGLPMRLFR